jgi:Uncharacterised nucleotidyltransferase
MDHADPVLDATEIARAVASIGAPGAASPEPVLVGAATWPHLLRRLRAERITGFALMSANHGWLGLTDEQRGSLDDVHRGAMVRCLSIEQKIRTLTASLDEESIGFAILKGASVAHTAYPEPSVRSFADVDLLVATSDFGRASRLLERSGHRRLRPEPRRGFDVRFGKASVHRRDDDRIEVDLHRTLVLGPFGLWMRPDELLERAIPFELGGVTSRRLDDTGMLLNAVVHASLGSKQPRLVPLRDVLQLAAMPGVDWQALRSWSVRWRLSAVFRYAFQTAGAWLRAPIPDAASSIIGVAPARREVRALAAYTSDRRDRGGTARATMQAIPGLAAKAAYARALAFPERDFLAARAGGTDTQPSYRRRLMIPARWARASLRGSGGRT